MDFSSKIFEIQKQLKEAHIDGWLLYDFHGSNRFAREILVIPADTVLTRRFFLLDSCRRKPRKNRSYD